MAWVTSTYLAIAAIVATAAGAGVSYYGQQQAAKTSSELALLNAQAQSQALAQQGRAASMQALINQGLADKERLAANANALALERQAEAGTRVSQENTRRTREEMARLIALQRSAIAKSGFVDTTGSPLALLAASAEEEQRLADEARYEDEISRRSLFREATMQRNSGVLAGIQGLGALASGAAGRSAAALGQSQARLDLYSARAAASGMRTQATGSLLTSAGSMTQSSYDAFRRTPRTARGQSSLNYASSYGAIF